MTPRQDREASARAFAEQLRLNPGALAAADAVWSNLNPQTTRYNTALSAAGAALLAASQATTVLLGGAQ